MPDARELSLMSRKELREVMRGGSPIDAESLVGFAYRGVSLGLPSFIERLTWKTFVKTFVRLEDGGVGGFNVRVEQAPLVYPAQAPAAKRNADGSAITFGPYRVEPLTDPRYRAPCKEGLMLDYAKADGARGVTSLMRDPITAVSAGSSDLLLGWMYAQVGWAIPTPSYFTLERVARVEPWLEGT